MTELKRVKVTMDLTARDAENANALKERLHSRSKASAVGVALSVTNTLTEALKEGSEIQIVDKNGDIKKVVIAGL